MNSKKGMFAKYQIIFSIVSFILLSVGSLVFGQDQKSTTIKINTDNISGIINKNIYGQFSEHLGNCIYGGIWVGENSKIPNTRGIRNDVIEALKKLQVPVLRWPGGCFADEYHWMDGIGPRESRPKMVNTNWGGVVEDNSFGTHEFLDFCELIGAEPYLCGNVGSGTVEELSKWVEYTTSDGENPMANLRRKNGKNDPWKIKYWGIGNESWGCGGQMRPEYYADLVRKYSNFTRNYGDNRVFKIASGPNVDDTTWTSVLMQQSGKYIDALALHYYTSAGAKPAAVFNEAGWFDVVKKALRTDEIIKMHSAVMDKYDSAKKIALIVDEWGTWFAVEPGTNPSFLYQQNTMRDAIVAASSLNIFNNHCDRVRMTNIAQMINVLQSMILTKDDKMVLTPTYYVFEMYNVHQDAILLPLDLKTSDYVYNGQSVPAVNGSASINTKGMIHISLCNVNPNSNEKVSINLENYENSKIMVRVLTSGEMSALNSFENPNNVIPVGFKDFKITGNNLEINMPAKSVIVLELNGKTTSKVGAPIQLKNPKSSLEYKMYDGIFYTLPDFKTLKVVKSDNIEKFKLPEESPSENFALKYSGYIKIPQDGFYMFYSKSDDGTKLYIDDKLTVLNDGRHAAIEGNGFASLTAGFHKIEVEFFQAGGGMEIELSFEGPNMKKQEIPASMLYHEN
jgi:alpha-L-arabinofuranosidase